jgi:hypothetical protein
MKHWTLTGLALMGVALAQAAEAGDFDGSKPLVCSTSLAIECSNHYECRNSPPEVSLLPYFLRVDVQKKTLTGERDGAEEITQIDRVANDEGLLMLQGLEHVRGWTMLISEETGRMSMTITDPVAGFVMFGACMRL